MKGDEEEYSLNYLIYDTENILTMATTKRQSEVGIFTNCCCISKHFVAYITRYLYY